MSILGTKIASVIFTLGLAFAVLAVGFGEFHLFGNLTVIPSTLSGLLIGAGLTALGCLLAYLRGERLSLSAPVLIICLALILISDIPYRRYNYYQSPPMAVELLIGGAAVLILAAFIPKAVMPLIMVLSLLSGLAGFLYLANGRFLVSDDHSSFLFRLIQLKENFPFIPFYSTEWNGGYEAREFFPSGILNVFFIFAPFIYLFDISSIYTYLVAALLFAVHPALIWLAARVVRFSIPASCAAVACSIYCSLLWYKWALVFGTIGFLTSLAAIPVVLALLAKASDESSNWRKSDAVLFFLASSLSLFWPLSTLILMPAGAFFLLNFKRIWRKAGMSAAVIALIVFHLPWMLIFAHASGVFNFVSSSTAGKAVHANYSAGVWKAFAELREAIGNSSTVILFLFTPGILLLKSLSLKRLTLVTGAWLLILGTTGTIFKPQLELNRMFMVLFFLLALPAGLAAAEFLRVGSEMLRARSWPGFLYLIPTVVLALTPFRLWKVATNQTVERFSFSNSLVKQLAEDIEEYCTGKGRTIFAGFTLHELEGGHVAPLASFTKLPLIAMSFQHNVWTYVDVFPEDFRSRGEEGILEYLDLYNVGCVIAHDRGWLRWFKKRPEMFQFQTKLGRFNLFTRTGFESNYFFSGAGRVLEGPASSIRLRLDTPEAVIKFNFLPFLRSDKCRLKSFPAGSNIQLIQLSACPTGAEIVISSIPPWSRLWRAFSGD
ncbi:MAG: hypothetical protein J5J00_06405 [Deltaproteobacteria bacterium]|nr:hypothetical protein [Deltaproteobacteria bacterium]